ncbi:MAG: glutamine--fructose-6-phosphate transaminase (isomerizing), partial [Victivallaceae bacterium]|nr:glutamine--fructose-6-phosphate transaminase (isomerizing) [Victivallaceae bacterium]
MCGIVGFAGKTPAKNILLDGLRKLEYRGYDSAGLALAPSDGGKLICVKAVGKVVNLVKAAAGIEGGNCTVGIAHTRWATHGAATEANAHPHLDASGEFAVVHNGIIENYAELKKRLEKENCVFRSETDSEVVAHLIAHFYNGDLVAAVASALKLVTGTYGLAVISSREPGKIVVARCGSPIVLGLAGECNLVASDIVALAAYTRKVIFLDDGDVAELTADDVKIRNLANVSVERTVTEIDWDVNNGGKGEYDHFMLKEIFEQPESTANTIRGRLDRNLNSACLNGLGLTPFELAHIRRIVIAACGTSMHAGMVGEYFFEDIAGIPSEVEQAAEFRYRNPIIDPDTLVLPISQSGETADTLAAVREAKNKGAIVAAICNVVGSTIARESGRGIYLHAGPEIGVASTKAFTSQVT